MGRSISQCWKVKLSWKLSCIKNEQSRAVSRGILHNLEYLSEPRERSTPAERRKISVKVICGQTQIEVERDPMVLESSSLERVKTWLDRVLSNLLWVWSWMGDFQRSSPASTTLGFYDWPHNSTHVTFVLFPFKTNLSTLKTYIPFGQACPSAFNCMARRGEFPLKVQWLWQHLCRRTFCMNIGSGIWSRYSRGELGFILLWKWHKWHQ